MTKLKSSGRLLCLAVLESSHHTRRSGFPPNPKHRGLSVFFSWSSTIIIYTFALILIWSVIFRGIRSDASPTLKNTRHYTHYGSMWLKYEVYYLSWISSSTLGGTFRQFLGIGRWNGIKWALEPRVSVNQWLSGLLESAPPPCSGLPSWCNLGRVCHSLSVECFPRQ